MKKRLPLLDSLRGFALYSMVAYHFLYDVNVVGGRDALWYARPLIVLWQHWGMGLFVLVSGMACSLMSASARWRRGLQLNALGLLITLATLLFLPEEKIICGILNFFGCALWCTQALCGIGTKAFARRPFAVKILLCLCGLILLRDLHLGAVKLCGLTLVRLPDFLQTDALAIFGLHSAEFSSADYVPLLPNIFIFWLGLLTLPWLRQNFPQLLEWGDWQIFTVPGRHSLLIYLLHLL